MTEQLEQVLTDFANENVLSGNLLITRGGRELLNRSYGHASLQLGVPNTTDTKFHIASVTKMFIATAALSFVEKGMIDLDDHPGTYHDRLQTLHPDIRIRHLLSHSSGLQDIYEVPNIRLEMSRLVSEQGDFLDYLVRLPQDFPPGEQWNYSTTGFMIVGYVLEAVTGKSYAQVLDELFFTPLGMTSTGVDSITRVNPDRAYGHTEENGQIINAANDRLSEITGAPTELYSTTGDLNRFCEALTAGKLLSQESLQKMFSPYYTTPFNPDWQYGFGWFLTPDFQMIGGGTEGFQSQVRYYPEADVRIIMLWNYEHVDSGKLLRTLTPLLLS